MTIEAPALSAEAMAEWTSHVESVLRGIAHALNNRAAALSALIELATEPAEEPPVIRSILGTELERVQGLVRVLRSIGVPRGAIEAFTPGDAAAEASSVLALHSDHRDVPVEVDIAGAQPIRVQRWMFVRAVIALGAGMTRGPSRGPARLTISAEDAWLEVIGTDTPWRTTPLVAELARAMGGDALPDRYGFRVPTLAALRQREGR
ncbi:MAG TPA: hypothetical protein VEB19_00505 [Gemmatimonadaceae bacterium]|nr:hypothetical protein [Gemmatimonadaceae bacterium]